MSTTTRVFNLTVSAAQESFIFLSAYLFPDYLEAIKSHEKSQDVVGAFKDTKDSQISQDPLNTSILHQSIRNDQFRLSKHLKRGGTTTGLDKKVLVVSCYAHFSLYIYISKGCNKLNICVWHQYNIKGASFYALLHSGIFCFNTEKRTECILSFGTKAFHLVFVLSDHQIAFKQS